jgi:two-component system sensor histidine kinase AtoS
MIGRVRDTMAEIERSRQMAAVGEFASQLAHEIRNPLTSIKLNMQKLERWSRRGRMPEETRKPLEITLREIDRLDRVVHGVLHVVGFDHPDGRARDRSPMWRRQEQLVARLTRRTRSAA